MGRRIPPMPAASKLPSLAFLAAHCGVSKATASKALSPIAERYRIAPATRERILAAARAMQFGAASRAGSHSGRFALLVRGDRLEWGSVNARLLLALVAALLRRRLDIRFESMDRGSVEARTRRLAKADGCLVIDTSLCDDATWSDWLRQIAAFPPTVVVNPGRRLPIPAVGPDDAGGCAALVRGLVERGHRRMAVVGHLGWGKQHGSQFIRDAALTATAAAAGVELLPWCDCTPEAVVVRWLAAGSAAPTALVQLSSMATPELLQRLTAAGIAVPGRLAIAQVDDPDYAVLLHPQVTSLGWSMPALVDKALTHLEAAMAGRPMPDDGLVPETVHWRGSTGPLRNGR